MADDKSPPLWKDINPMKDERDHLATQATAALKTNNDYLKAIRLSCQPWSKGSSPLAGRDDRKAVRDYLKGTQPSATTSDEGSDELENLKDRIARCRLAVAQRETERPDPQGFNGHPATVTPQQGSSMHIQTHTRDELPNLGRQSTTHAQRLPQKRPAPNHLTHQVKRRQLPGPQEQGSGNTLHSTSSTLEPSTSSQTLADSQTEQQIEMPATGLSFSNTTRVNNDRRSNSPASNNPFLDTTRVDNNRQSGIRMSGHPFSNTTHVDNNRQSGLQVSGNPFSNTTHVDIDGRQIDVRGFRANQTPFEHQSWRSSPSILPPTPYSRLASNGPTFFSAHAYPRSNRDIQSGPIESMDEEERYFTPMAPPRRFYPEDERGVLQSIEDTKFNHEGHQALVAADNPHGSQYAARARLSSRDVDALEPEERSSPPPSTVNTAGTEETMRAKGPQPPRRSFSDRAKPPIGTQSGLKDPSFVHQSEAMKRFLETRSDNLNPSSILQRASSAEPTTSLPFIVGQGEPVARSVQTRKASEHNPGAQYPLRVATLREHTLNAGTMPPPRIQGSPAPTEVTVLPDGQARLRSRQTAPPETSTQVERIHGLLSWELRGIAATSVPYERSRETPRWRTSDEMDRTLGTQLLYELYSRINDQQKSKRWKAYPAGDRSCILTDVIGRGKNPSTWAKIKRACDRCIKAKRPCVTIETLEGVETLCFHALPSADRGAVADWRDLGCYVQEPV